MYERASSLMQEKFAAFLDWGNMQRYDVEELETDKAERTPAAANARAHARACVRLSAAADVLPP